MIDFKQINKEFSIIEAAQALQAQGYEALQDLHQISAYQWRTKSVFAPNVNKTCTDINIIKNSWYDHKEDKGGGVLELWALVKYGSDSDIDCKKKAAQDINDLVAGKFGSASTQTRKSKFAVDFMKLFNQNVEKWHSRLLSTNPEAVKALQYLHDRRITDNTIKRFKIGLCVQSIPTGKNDNEGKPEYKEELRISFPYFDEGNQAIYLVTRRLDWLASEKSPKYKKGVRTSDIASFFYKKEELNSYTENCPLGLNTLPIHLKDRDTIILGEGVVDFLSVVQEGYSALFSVGGSFGKDKDSEVLAHAKKFRHIITMYDSDESGINFTYKQGKKFMEADLPFYIVDSYGDGHKDISDYYTSGGVISELVKNARCGYVFLAEQLMYQEFNGYTYYGLSREDKAKMTTEIKKLFDGLAERITTAELKQVREAILKYYPECLLKEAEKGLSAQEKYKEKICAYREIFLREKFSSDYGKSYNLMYVGSVKHGEYYGYNQETQYWQRFTDADIQSGISEQFAHKELPKTVKDISEAVRMKVTKSTRPKFNTKPLFGFNNGVLELDTGIFREHNPEDYLTFQVAYNYDEKATCPKFDKFIQEVTNENQSRINFLDDMMSYILYHDCRFEKIFFLIGSGRNGKSVFLQVLESLFRNSNESDTTQSVTHIQPKDFQDATKRILLSKSILNIAYDIEPNLRGCESYLKSIATGEAIDGNYKFCDTENFTSRAKIISSCNHMPILRDSSEGMSRRPMFCKFEVDFTGREDKGLKYKLIEELPGIFNRVYRAYQELIKRDEIREAIDQREFLHDFKETANPVLVFWEYAISNEKLDFDNTPKLKSQVYELYKNWCDENRIRDVMPLNIFHKEFKRTLSALNYVKLEEHRKKLGSVQYYTYTFKLLSEYPEAQSITTETSDLETKIIEPENISTVESESEENNISNDNEILTEFEGNDSENESFNPLYTEEL